MSTVATYFDGKSAQSHEVNIVDDGVNLIFSGAHTSQSIWAIKGLHAIDPPTIGQPFRLTHDANPGARLIIRDQAFIDRLISRSAHLKGGYSSSDIRHLLGWTFGGIAFFAMLGYVLINVLPGPVGRMLPNSWRDKSGLEMEQAMAGSAKKCSSPAADHAWAAMIASLAEGDPDLPPLTVHVYDLPMTNAFTVTGGHVIFTRALIEKADRPEEVAGVLAHEIGHVVNYHAEAQMVRLTGLSIFSSFFGSGGNGTATSNAVFVAAVLRNSRAAEEEADAYARNTLAKAHIDPSGLKVFFKKLLKIEGERKIDNLALNTLGNIFSTHPGTEERIEKIAPLPSGVVAKQVLPEEDWAVLKALCK